VQTPLMAYELEQLAVVAVVWDAEKRRALISDPRGETHVVKEGSPIGKNDGLVIHIGDNMVLVKETYVDFAGEMTTKDVELRIRRSQGG
jgi:type IV pilus assembly protein PilP